MDLVIEETAREPLSMAREKLREVFGFTSFREGQEQAIAAVFAGRDVLVVMPTGSGKSLCYQVPALALPGVTMVVSPLIALMKDQVDALTLRGAPVTFINSSISAEEQWSRLAGLEGGAYKLIYVAPERFRSRAFRAAISRVAVSLLAIDEAHCISQWGHDFRPDYRRLTAVRETLRPPSGAARVPAIALTATATPEVRDDILRELDMQDPLRVVTGFDRPNLGIEVAKVRSRSHKEESLEEFLRAAARRAEDGGVPAGVIYVGTRKRAEEVSKRLTGLAIQGAGGRLCRAYHAGLEAEERREVQEDFMEGRLPWVAATNAFGMGVDKSDIRFVVHFDLPGSIEAYYQEIGRGGRDGRPAQCLLLFSEGDRRLQEFFIEGSNPPRVTIEAVYRFLFGLGERTIFRTLVELEARFREVGGSRSENPLVFRSSVAILERAGALERLDHFENLAEVAPLAVPWPSNRYPERATVKHALFTALGRVFERNDGEAAAISLETWASELAIPEESLRRGLSQFEEEGLVSYLPPFRGRAIRLPAEPVLLGDCIDFKALARRRERDLDRLEEVIRFAKAGTCRRDAILRYFGEPAPSEGCGRCDACHGRAASRPARALDDRELTLVRKTLSGVARARGRCGRGRVIAMLRGSRARAMTDLGLTGLSTFGILRDHPREALHDVFDLLEADGCILQAGDRYPVVQLTERGVRVMKGEERPQLALEPRLTAVRPAQRAEDPAAPRARPADEPWAQGQAGDDEMAECDAALFEKLRHLRRQIADELRVPAYRVFNDRTLRAMSRGVPRTEEEMLRIPGVGTRTLERFGGRFLGVLRDHGA